MTETTAELNGALAAAQRAFPPINREKKVTVRTKEGGSYTFAYATLDAILNAVRPVLNDHGLSIVQLLEQDDGRPQIRTELRHESGQVIGSAFPLPVVPSSAQQLGSLLTYLRRYAITALLGVAAEEDDDGQQAAYAKPAAKPAAKPKPSGGPEPLRRLYAWMNKRGLGQDAQLNYASAVVDRDLDSLNDLELHEINDLIHLLSDDTTEWPNAGS